MIDKKQELDNKVNSLVNQTDGKKIVCQLQEIGALLLTDFEVEIQTKDIITVEFLRVEPYFFNPNVFEDKFTHRDEASGIYGPNQRDRCGELYIHKGFSGVDIVLSHDKNYALSFLIKNSRVLINDEPLYPSVKQIELAEILKKYGIPNDYNNVVLKTRKTPKNSVVFNTVRKGLRTVKARKDFEKDEQSHYNTLAISSLIELKEHTSSQFDYESKYGKEWAVAYYLFKHNIEATDENIKKYLGSKSSSVKKKVEELEKENLS